MILDFKDASLYLPSFFLFLLFLWSLQKHVYGVGYNGDHRRSLAFFFFEARRSATATGASGSAGNRYIFFVAMALCNQDPRP